MPTKAELKAKADELRKALAKVDRLTGKAETNQAAAERMRLKRAADRDLSIPRVANRDRRLRCLADVYEFLQTYFADVFYQPFTPSRREMIDAIVRAARESGDQAIAGPRGDGKTRSAIFTGLWLAITGLSTFPMVISKSGERSEVELRNIKWALKSSTTFAEDFPELAVPIEAIGGWASRARQMTVYGHSVDMEWSTNSIAFPTISTSLLRENGWNEDLESIARGQMFVSLGIEGPIRGYNVRNKRPTMAIIDDIDDRESAKSAVQTETRTEIIDSDVAGLGGPDCVVSRVFLCTLINRTCAAWTFTDRKARHSFRGQRHKLISAMPERQDLWAEYVALRSGRDVDQDPDGRAAHQFYLERREEMERGHETTNPYRFNQKPLSDGLPAEVSSLQAYYNFVADKGLAAALTELQNDPPPDEDETRLPITGYHIRNNCRTGRDRGLVPDDTVAITIGGDIKKLGMHHVTIAWNDRAVGSIIDYDFYPFATEGLKPQACELLILEGLQEWWKKRTESPFCEASGAEWRPDVVVIDSGWKADGWNYQPVYTFADWVGGDLIIPSKGIPTWAPKRPGPKVYPGDNFNLVVISRGRALAEVNADHWKIRVHEGFLQPFGEPGSLGLFNPARDQWGRESANAHLNYAKHITSERWGQHGPSRRWCWAPADGGRIQKPNHYLDATALALCGRAMVGVSTIQPEPAVAMTTPAAPVVSDIQETEYNASGYVSSGGRSW